MLFVGLLTALPAFAQQVQVQLEPPRLQVGQTGRMTIFMVGEKTRSAPQFEPPESVKVEFDGSYSRFQTDGFNRFMVYAYRYRVTALEEGKVLLGGWDFELSTGKTVKAQTAALEVIPSSALEFDELQVTAGFNVETAWEGQVVVYDYELISKVPFLSVDWRHPEFEGLRPTVSGNRSERNYEIGNPDGNAIHVTGGSIPLVAAGTGERNQPGTLANVRIAEGRSVFPRMQQYRSKRVVTDGAKLELRPLVDIPDNHSGLVGEFQIRSRVDKTKAAVGESITWTLEIAGDGSLDGWEAPALPEVPGITVYESDGKVEAWIKDGEYQARGVFPRVIVANEPGIL